MAGTLALPRSIHIEQSAIQTLDPNDIPRLRLPAQRSAHSLRQLLELHPGRSVWSPATLEYAIVGPWRNRPEISCIDELAAAPNVEPLLRSAFERCVDHGDDLMLAIELDTQRSPTRYERADMELLEEVITYEMETPRAPWQPDPSLRLVPVEANDGSAIDWVTRLDLAAFPWLWRNSRKEFDVYLRTPGVELAAIEANGEPVAYIGVTLFVDWGHLDRIAVAPDQQGRGLGRQALGLAIEAMRRGGARRIALSTQRTNRRSQRLYERFGFRRTFDHDYRLYGRWRGQAPHAVHQSI